MILISRVLSEVARAFVGTAEEEIAQNVIAKQPKSLNQMKKLLKKQLTTVLSSRLKKNRQLQVFTIFSVLLPMRVQNL